MYIGGMDINYMAGKIFLVASLLRMFLLKQVFLVVFQLADYFTYASPKRPTCNRIRFHLTNENWRANILR